MVIRQRAVQAEDKLERRDAILDAAERHLVRTRGRPASVAEVADEAGLAKGTVYLYFPSKDELLLALHERHVDDFFAAMEARLAGPVAIGIDDLLALTQSHIVGRPTFLPLATFCHGAMGGDVPRDRALAFKERMSMRLTRAGAALERHFPQLTAGEGLALLRHSYALVLGLWQMSSAIEEGAAPCAGPIDLYRWDYATELRRALRYLWEGAIGQALPATTVKLEAGPS